MRQPPVFAMVGVAILAVAPQQARLESLGDGTDQAEINRVRAIVTWWYAQAPAYAEKCPIFVINASRAKKFLGEYQIDIDDFDKGHKYRALFMELFLRARVNFSEYSEAEACQHANKAYGANGFLIKNLLKEKD